MKPNFLMIVADQHRADAYGAAGRFPISTPNLDALCARGTRFENAFTPLPVCAPARQSMLCGRNPDSYGAFWNYGFFSASSLAPAGYWPEQLKRDGFRTAFYGKWSSSQDHGPEEFGYDSFTEYDGFYEMLEAKYPNYHGNSWFGGPCELPLEDSRTHWLAKQVADGIREMAKGDTPWHIRVDYPEPHLPCNVSEPFYSMYKDMPIPPWDGANDPLINKPYIQRQQQMNWGLDGMTWEDWQPCVRHYYGMVSQVDDSIGIILRALEESGQLENTVVLYTSDHGDTSGSRGMLDKHYILYDDVVRVPYIVAGPGIQKGVTVSEFISNGLDLAPTVDELFGVKSPEAQGRSLVPLLRGEHPSDWRQEITASSNGQQFGFFNQRMLRDKKWKYIFNMTDIDELYDLENDPGEKTNLSGDPAYRDLMNGMRKRLYAILKEQGDPFIVDSKWLNRALLEGKKV